MQFWIAAWVFVFAAGLLVASQANAEDRRANRGTAVFMLALMGAAAFVMYRA